MIAGQLFTTGKLAERWQCSRQHVRDLIHEGKLLPLPWCKQDRIWYVVDLENVLKFEQQQAEETVRILEARIGKSGVESLLENLKIAALAKILGTSKGYIRKTYFAED